VPGRAWRYVPNQRVRTAARSVNKPIQAPPATRRGGRQAGKLPLTDSIRRYFWANPGRVIYIDELQEMMSTDDVPLSHDQVRVGVSNARQNHDTFRNELLVVSPGRAWQYNGEVNVSADASNVDKPRTDVKTHVAVVPIAPTQPVAVVPVNPSNDVPVTAPVAPPVAVNDQDLLLLEKVGKSNDGALLVRDSDRQMYRLYPL
jgi:hypothetical protein